MHLVYSPRYHIDIGPHVFPTLKYALVHDALRAGGRIPASSFVEPEPASETIEPDPEDFLSYYSWPVNSKTGERLNWLTLPVIDKRWVGKHGEKGGFIQEATGWKPAVLQPFVYLPSLLKTR